MLKRINKQKSTWNPWREWIVMRILQMIKIVNEFLFLSLRKIELINSPIRKLDYSVELSPHYVFPLMNQIYVLLFVLNHYAFTTSYSRKRNIL